MKKIVSMLIAALMILTALPLAALADDGNGDGYNDNDLQKISTFLALEEDGVTNAGKLGYASADDPAAWTDVGWESDGSELRAVSISWWSEQPLTGTLDLSGCDGLRELYCSGNGLEALSLDGCTALEMLGCGGNSFSSLDISGCPAIKYFESYGSPLKHIHASIGGAQVTLDAPDGCVRIFYCDSDMGYEFPMLIVTAVPVSLPFGSWTGTQDGAPYSSDSLTLNLTPGSAYSLSASFSSNPVYNDHDLVKLQTFLIDEPLEWGNSNANQLGYDTGDPSTWSGVEWDDSAPKRLAAIDWNNRDIAGEFDLSGCTSLETVSCPDNSEIITLDLSGCTSLTGINWPNGFLHELNVNGCAALTSLVCTGGYISELDLTDCIMLSNILCSSYELRNISAYLNNTTVDLTAAGPGHIDLSYNGGDVAYATAVPYYSQFYSWNFEWGQTLSNEADIELYLGGEESAIYTANFLSSVTYNEHDMDKIRAFLAQGTNAQTLGCDIDDPATWTDVDWGTAGEELRATYINWSYKNHTGPLDLSGCESLKSLNCSGSTVGSLDVSGCTALYSLVCEGCGLTSVNISGCGALGGLYCTNNSLTSLDVSGCRGLEDLSCEYNSLTGLDVSGFGELDWLYCNDNALETLDVSGCVNLVGLYCSNNALGELELGGCEKLEALNCGANNIDSLDVSGCPVEYLVCSDNPLNHIRAKAEGKDITLAGAGGSVRLAYSVYYDEDDIRHIEELSAAAVSAELPFAGWTGERDGVSFASGEAEIDLTPGAEYDITANFGYRVMYDGNGAAQGTAPVSPSGYGEGNTVTVCGNTGGLEKEGYELAGWNTAANGGGTHYSADGTDGFLMPAHEVTLYAEWTPVVYSISYDLGGGLASNSASYTVETPGFTLNNPVRYGYVFTGWTGTGILGTAMSVTVSMGSTGDRMYTANWSMQEQSCDLASVGLSSGSLSRAFSREVTGYNITLGEDEGSLTLTPVKEYVGASMTINGRAQSSYTISLANGKSAKITVKVSAGRNSKTYTFTVTRAKSTNNYLSSLTATAGTWSQAFDPDVVNYTLTLGADTRSTTIRAAASAGRAARVSPASKKISLRSGQSKTVKITVRAQSGAKRTYTITVVRAGG